MKKLPDVTLLAISSDRVESNVKALEHSMKLMEFGAVKFLSHRKPEYLPEGIQFEECAELKCIRDFDYYAFKELGKHVTTSHALMIQDHAYLLHTDVWRDEFLNFDFCGALWEPRMEFLSPSSFTLARLGNGGFSLRSKRIMDLPKKLDLPLVEDRGYTNDDGQINVYWRKTMLENGIVYPEPWEIADFAYENDTPENLEIEKYLGFHRNIAPRMMKHLTKDMIIH